MNKQSELFKQFADVPLASTPVDFSLNYPYSGSGKVEVFQNETGIPVVQGLPIAYSTSFKDRDALSAFIKQSVASAKRDVPKGAILTSADSETIDSNLLRRSFFKRFLENPEKHGLYEKPIFLNYQHMGEDDYLTKNYFKPKSKIIGAGNANLQNESLFDMRKNYLMTMINKKGLKEPFPVMEYNLDKYKTLADETDPAIRMSPDDNRGTAYPINSRNEFRPKVFLPHYGFGVLDKGKLNKEDGGFIDDLEELQYLQEGAPTYKNGGAAYRVAKAFIDAGQQERDFNEPIAQKAKINYIYNTVPYGTFSRTGMLDNLLPWNKRRGSNKLGRIQKRASNYINNVVDDMSNDMYKDLKGKTRRKIRRGERQADRDERRYKKNPSGDVPFLAGSLFKDKSRSRGSSNIGSRRRLADQLFPNRDLDMKTRFKIGTQKAKDGLEGLYDRLGYPALADAVQMSTGGFANNMGVNAEPNELSRSQQRFENRMTRRENRFNPQEEPTDFMSTGSPGMGGAGIMGAGMNISNVMSGINEAENAGGVGSQQNLGKDAKLYNVSRTFNNPEDDLNVAFGIGRGILGRKRRKNMEMYNATSGMNPYGSENLYANVTNTYRGQEADIAGKQLGLAGFDQMGQMDYTGLNTAMYGKFI